MTDATASKRFRVTPVACDQVMQTNLCTHKVGRPMCLSARALRFTTAFSLTFVSLLSSHMPCTTGLHWVFSDLDSKSFAAFGHTCGTEDIDNHDRPCIGGQMNSDQTDPMQPKIILHRVLKKSMKR